jgi:uncharacterized protein YbcI
MRRKTRGELEAEIKQALIQFEKEYMGRGPLEVHAFLIGDMVLVRLLGVLTTAEHKLIQSNAETRTRYLIKQMRQELLERGRPLLAKAIKNILNVDMKSLHTDISTRTGERIIVFTLAARPEYDEPDPRRLRNGKPLR